MLLYQEKLIPSNQLKKNWCSGLNQPLCFDQKHCGAIGFAKKRVLECDFIENL